MRKVSLNILLLIFVTAVVSGNSYCQGKENQPQFFNNQSFSNAKSPPPVPQLIGDIGGGSDSVPIDDGIMYLFAGAIVVFSRNKIRQACYGGYNKSSSQNPE